MEREESMNKMSFAAYENIRLDKFLLGELDDITRSQIKLLIEGGNVAVNERTATKAGYALRAGEIVDVVIPPIEELSLEGEDIPLDVVYEDADLAVINKPKGMVVHPAKGSPNGTLVNALIYRFRTLSDVNGSVRPGIVHRLDKDTSGLIVVAKNNFAHANLASQIADRSAGRVYVALLDGIVKQDEGRIETFIGRHTGDRLKMAVLKEGKEAVTLYRVLERYDRYTLTECELKTGRTHQIRVHAKHINHPVTGDALYGGSTKVYGGGQLLTAVRLTFKHPRTGEEMRFEIEVPEYFKSVIDRLRG